MLRNEGFLLYPEAPWKYINELFFEFSKDVDIYIVTEEARKISEESINGDPPTYETIEKIQKLLRTEMVLLEKYDEWNEPRQNKK